MKNETAVYQQNIANQAVGTDFTGHIQFTLRKSADTNRPFFILILKIENLSEFRKKRPAHVVNGLMREIFSAVRTAVHPSQYVGYYQDGLGLVFDAVDPGKVDTIARRLVSLTQNVIRSGHYNDLTSRWTDILQQFLWPSQPGLLFTRVGWAIFPRDGAQSSDLIKRAHAHAAEISR